MQERSVTGSKFLALGERGGGRMSVYLCLICKQETRSLSQGTFLFLTTFVNVCNFFFEASRTPGRAALK